VIDVRRQPARSVALGLLALVLVAAAAIGFVTKEEPTRLAPRDPNGRPHLLLLTTLPLIFPEQFSVQGGGSAALQALESRYEIVPISVADAPSLRHGRFLLMAHPLAQPAQALVDLDKWVRGGGRLLLLADPRLDWPSERPLGDKLRPPPAFADTGLLAHWGLRLEAPGETPLIERKVGRHHVLLSSPGVLAGSCPTAADGLVARCALGKGRATIIADADLLQPHGASANQIDENLDFVLAELALLENTTH
jgi:hypothetical protein